MKQNALIPLMAQVGLIFISKIVLSYLTKMIIDWLVSNKYMEVSFPHVCTLSFVPAQSARLGIVDKSMLQSSNSVIF